MTALPRVTRHTIKMRSFPWGDGVCGGKMGSDWEIDIKIVDQRLASNLILFLSQFLTMQFRFMMDYISWQPSLKPNLVNSSFNFLSLSIVISRSTVFPIVFARYNAIFFSLSLKMTSQRTVYPVWHTFLSPPFTSLTFPIRMMKKQPNSSPILYSSAELRIRGLPILSRQTLTILWFRLANGLKIYRDYTVCSKLASFLIFMALGIAWTAFRNFSFASQIRLKSAQEAYFFLCDSIWVIFVPFLEISAISVFTLLSGEAWVLNLMAISFFFCLDCSPS